jgi:hypothetical protein
MHDFCLLGVGTDTQQKFDRSDDVYLVHRDFHGGGGGGCWSFAISVVQSHVSSLKIKSFNDLITVYVIHIAEEFSHPRNHASTYIADIFPSS